MIWQLFVFVTLAVAMRISTARFRNRTMLIDETLIELFDTDIGFKEDILLDSLKRADEGQKEYVLFSLSDSNHDMLLTRTELDDIFLLFDADNNTEITEAEFVFDWENKFNLGNGEEARALFSKADIDDDGVIDSNDIPGIFAFFDTNGDGEVDINEFLTQWGYLEKNPNNTVDVNVSVDFDG